MSYNKNLYIHPENQELLWKNINKIPMFQMMGQGIPNYKEQWFKTIIENFYEKYPIVDSRELLQKINKATLGYMIEVLKSNSTSQQNARMNIPQRNMGSANVVPNINGFQEANYLGKDAEKAQKQEFYNQAFGERQKQYEQLFAKPPAPDIDFSIKMEDRPISNMDELIEKHKKEREEELNKFSPLNNFLPPPTQLNNTPLPPSIPINKPGQPIPPSSPSLPLSSQQDNINISIVEKSSPQVQNNSSSEYSFQKILEEHTNILRLIAGDISDIKQKYNVLLEKIDKIELEKNVPESLSELDLEKILVEKDISVENI